MSLRHAAAASFLSLLVGAAAAQADTCTHRVVAAAPQHLALRLRAAAVEGFTVAAVARPDASAPLHVPVVVLAKSTASAGQVEIRAEWARSLSDLEAAVNAAVGGGARLRGVTRADLTAPAWGPWLAVLEQGAGKPAGGAPSYRLVLSRGQAAEWRQLEEAAREGYRVVDVLWWADRTLSALGEVVFVAERAPAASPRELELVWEPVAKLDARLEKLAAAGWHADVAWTSRDYVNVLMSRPRGGSHAPAGDHFEVDEDPGSPGVSASTGRLVERLSFRDGQVAIYDRRHPAASYVLESGPLVAGVASGTTASTAEIQLAGRLDRAGRGGLCAFDAVWQEQPGRSPELVVLLRRPPATE